MRYPHQIVGTDVVETDLYSVRYDGSELLNMVDTRRSKWVPQFRDRVIDYLEDDPEHVLMALDLDQPAVMDLYKVNVNTARRSRVLRGRENVVAWMTDRQQRVRAMVTLLHGKYVIQVREIEGRQWRTLWEYEAFTPDVITPMGFDWDPNILYARGYHDGRFAVFKVDLEDAELTKQLMHSNPKYDVEGSLIYSTHQKKVLGIRDARHSGGYVIWERDYEPVLRSVAMRLPHTRNLLVDTSRDESRFILIARNDTHPGTFYYGDRKTGELTGFARRYPQLHPEVLAQKKKVQYVAADGQRIDGYLTLPRDAEPGVKLPTIIHPHGGPAQRTQQGFDYWSAFFADRGYAVLQMDFRGSSGSGYEFMASAFQNWDTVTQMDIADGTRYMIEKGIADPDRICIVGGSFGGYAALMGVAAAGGLYKCAISFAGVSDLVAVRDRARRFVNAELTVGQIGSRGRDLRAASPVFLVENIDDPVLLIHGATDRVVDVDQSRDMFEAMKSAGKVVEYVELPTGNHYLSNHFDRIQTFELMEAFLAKHL
jgi:dipeptidyl aminopeptidase/acylaminoacyl peptidase